MSSGCGNPAGRVRLRYRRADGEFTDTTLERVVVEDVVAGLPVRYGRRRWLSWRAACPGICSPGSSMNATTLGPPLAPGKTGALWRNRQAGPSTWPGSGGGAMRPGSTVQADW
jgi:hypothetical protein